MEIIKNIGIKKLVIILLCGVALMMLTFSEVDFEDDTTKNNSTQQSELEEMLRTIDGVEETKVMITYDEKSQAKGALIIVKGAKDSNIINEIIDAVQVLFDLPVHKIKVMKMK